MPLQGLDISLNVRNNTNYPQQINVMGNPSNLLDTANATTEYRYDLTGFTITNETSISIPYRRIGDPTFFTFTFDLEGTQLNSIVIALNNLGIGYFNLYDELGNTYIGTYNQQYEFGNLNVYNSTPTTTTTTTTTTIPPTTTTTTTTTTLAPTTTTTTTTTTLVPSTAFNLQLSLISQSNACATYPSSLVTYFATFGSTLINGTILYTDNTLTTPIANGYYSNGTNSWLTAGGNGILANQSACIIPTTTTTTTTTTLAPTTTTTTTTTTLPASTAFNLQPSAIDQADACTNYPSGLVTYFATFGSTLVNGTILYTNNTLTIPIADGYYSNGTNSWLTSGGNGILASQSACIPPTSTTTTTTTTTIGPVVFNLSTSLISGQDACVEYPLTIPYYASPGSPLTNFTILYYDSALTTLANNGYYSDGVNNWQISGGNGTLTNQTGCIPTTTTTTTTTTAPPFNWQWIYNNAVEAPPFGGGYINIDVNAINVVNQSDLSSIATTYSGNLTIVPGDLVAVTIYTYANNTYGTQTFLQVEDPSGNILYTNTVTQPLPGSPSTLTYTFTATTSNIVITSQSNSN